MTAAAIEEAVHVQFSEGDYKTRIRTIIFNLKDKKNPELRRRVVLGEIPPEEFAGMSSEEMASDTKQDEIKKIRYAIRLIQFMSWAPLWFLSLLSYLGSCVLSDCGQLWARAAL